MVLSVKENVFFLINNFASKEDGAGKKKKKPSTIGYQETHSTIAFSSSFCFH